MTNPIQEFNLSIETHPHLDPDTAKDMLEVAILKYFRGNNLIFTRTLKLTHKRRRSRKESPSDAQR